MSRIILSIFFFLFMHVLGLQWDRAFMCSQVKNEVVFKVGGVICGMLGCINLNSVYLLQLSWISVSHYVLLNLRKNGAKMSMLGCCCHYSLCYWKGWVFILTINCYLTLTWTPWAASWRFWPAPACSRLVEEFYANLHYTAGKRVFLRGCQVDFSFTAINNFYQTPKVENNAFTRMLDSEVNWEEVLDTIGHLGSHWTYHAQPSTEPRHLENRFLNTDTWVWL